MDSSPAVDVLLKILHHHQETYIRYASLLALRASGQGAEAEVLRELLSQSYSKKDEFTLAEQAASDTIFNSVTPRTPKAIPILVSALKSKYFEKRRIAALALSNMGSAAKLAIPKIVVSMKEEMKARDYTGISIYAGSLINLGTNASMVSDSVFEIMIPTSSFLSKGYDMNAFRIEWLGVLAAIGIPKDERKRQFVMSQVLISLKDVDGTNFGVAAKVAGQMKTNAAQLIAPLTLILKSGERSGGLIAPHDKEHQDHATHSYNWQNPDTIIGFKEVIRALGNLGANANFAVPILQRYSEMPASAPLAEAKTEVRAALKKIVADKPKKGVERKDNYLKNQLLGLHINDVQGKTIQLGQNERLILFFFADTTCPCVQAYIGRLRVLQAKYQQKVQLIVVFPNLQEGKTLISDFAVEKKIPGLIVRDDKQQITKLLKAQRTAQTILIDLEGRIQYSGRIDDNIYNTKKIKDKALEQSIQQVLSGNNVSKHGILPLSCELVY